MAPFVNSKQLREIYAPKPLKAYLISSEKETNGLSNSPTSLAYLGIVFNT